MATRGQLDYDYVIPALLRSESYEQIAIRESLRLGTSVSRSLIAGVARDLKDGRLRPSSAGKDSTHYLKTYVYGVEPDNGGLPLFTGHLTIDGDAVVTNDWHAPFIHRKFAESVIPWARYFGIKRMIIAGDMTDGSSQNNFRRKVIPVAFTTEIEVTRHLLRFYGEYFDEIVFEPGNHDDWFMENMGGHLAVKDYYNLLGVPELEGKLIITPYDRVTLISGGERWIIPHQAEVSKYSLEVGNRLAHKFEANVIVPHQHNSADGWDIYHRYRVIDSGGLFDPNMLSYINLKTTTRPMPDQGFVAVKGGRGVLITPDRRQTDWSVIKE